MLRQTLFPASVSSFPSTSPMEARNSYSSRGRERLSEGEVNLASDSKSLMYLLRGFTSALSGWSSIQRLRVSTPLERSSLSQADRGKTTVSE
jgi:hypothetical protein